MTDKFGLQEDNFAAAGSSFTTKVIWGCLLFTTTVAVIGLVLSAIALTKYNAPPPPVATPKHGGGTGGGTGGTAQKVTLNILPPKKPRSYTIAHGHDFHAHEYLDAGGVVRGFSLELIKAVCKAAEMKCFTIWEPYTNCWDSVPGQHQRAGKGLAGRWYDGCVAWAVSNARNQSMGFTDSYTLGNPAFLFKKINTNFNWNVITGKKIGFMDGWVDDEKCMARQTGITGNVLGVDQIKHYKTQPEMLEDLQNGKVDAAFATIGFLNVPGANTTVTKGPNKYFCMFRGSAVIARKDSVDFMERWNKGFRRIRMNGVFQKMCANANDRNETLVKIECVT